MNVMTVVKNLSIGKKPESIIFFITVFMYLVRFVLFIFVIFEVSIGILLNNVLTIMTNSIQKIY